LVESCPSYLHKKALKVVAAKLALAVRCDFVNVDTGRARNAASGEAFRATIEEQIQQWQAPDKAQVLKALPKYVFYTRIHDMRNYLFSLFQIHQVVARTFCTKIVLTKLPSFSPRPDLTVKKRRGGKRMRRLKERFEETELMKQANTRAFSSQVGEYGDDAMGLTMGMLAVLMEVVQFGRRPKSE
jgi:U4/U6 small nuclear ribonucleoprotein PRP31